ncbi:hypothetical protein PACTADRAFT_2463 [Pachysolen tannophilus NRRL Y-2460]|uniref:Uncharacterized protein n=1 Tax=Pachysolen tannophilus NRRL Y-2460 TaxID=669874 RepID=A0A1E4TWY4_PACTA|nr:hypothetical protein PACTADRAFT_2463 [Pachysolen tannophilus NRRL Y-2460]
MSFKSSIFSKPLDVDGSSSVIVSNYNSKGILPRLLSPTLPSSFDIQEPTPPESSTTPVVIRQKKSTSGSYTVISNNDGVIDSVEVKLNIKRKPVGLGISRANADNEKINMEDQEEYSDSDDEPLSRKKQKKKLSSTVLDKRKEKSELFLSKSKHFVNLATLKKRESDSLRNKNSQLSHSVCKKSLLISIDSLIIFIVAFDYEDKSRLVLKLLASEDSWLSLLPFLNSIIRNIEEAMELIENGNHTGNENDNRRGSSLRYLLGLVHLIKGMVYQHLEEICTKKITNSHLKTKTIIEDHKKKLLKDLIVKNSLSSIDYRENLNQSFTIFEKYLNYTNIKISFPQTFKKRSLVIEPKPLKESLRPSADPYYLPINSCYSTFQEVVGFSYNLVKEWSETQGLIDTKQIEWALEKI